MTFDSIIFDLDGTLWDTASLCATAWNRGFEKLELENKGFTREDIGKLMGQTPEEIATGFLGRFPRVQALSIVETCYQEEIEIIRTSPAPLYPGVKEGIEKLHAKRPLFIVSNCEVMYLDTFLSTSGLEKYFKDVECHGRTRQPKGENLKDIIQRNQVSRPLFVGDTMSDSVAAEQAEANFCWASYGFGKVDKYHFTVKDFPSLVAAISEGKPGYVSPR